MSIPDLSLLVPADGEGKVEPNVVVEGPATSRTTDPHDPNVDNNVIDSDLEMTSRPSTEQPSPDAEPGPSHLTMPRMASLSDLTLHSPSQIVGTPFAVTSPRFEYPFPETNSASSVPDSFPASISLPSLSNPISTSSFPSLSISPPISGFTSNAQSHPARNEPSLQYPTSFPPPQDLPSYSPTHPKMRTGRDPPVPPGLAKKRQRWSLGLLKRRSGSYENQASNGSTTSGGIILSSDSFVDRERARTISEERGKHLERSIRVDPPTPNGLPGAPPKSDRDHEGARRV